MRGLEISMRFGGFFTRRRRTSVGGDAAAPGIQVSQSARSNRAPPESVHSYALEKKSGVLSSGVCIKEGTFTFGGSYLTLSECWWGRPKRYSKISRSLPFPFFSVVFLFLFFSCCKKTRYDIKTASIWRGAYAFLGLAVCKPGRAIPVLLEFGVLTRKTWRIPKIPFVFFSL